MKRVSVHGSLLSQYSFPNATRLESGTESEFHISIRDKLVTPDRRRTAMPLWPKLEKHFVITSEDLESSSQPPNTPSRNVISGRVVVADACRVSLEHSCSLRYQFKSKNEELATGTEQEENRLCSLHAIFSCRSNPPCILSSREKGKVTSLAQKMMKSKIAGVTFCCITVYSTYFGKTRPRDD